MSTITLNNKDTSTLSPGKGNKVPAELRQAKRLRITGSSGKTMDFTVKGASEYQVYVDLKGKHTEAEALPFKGELEIEVVE
jgi:hypothetical protein